MDMNRSVKQKAFALLESKYFILIAIGIGLRIFCLVFSYVEVCYSDFGNGALGDVLLNFYDIESVFTGEWSWNQDDLAYPPISVFFLVFLRVSAFNNLYVFFFYGFLLELLTISLFYPVLKKFKVKHSKAIMGLLFVNPFYFFSYVARFFISGIRITDSFFCLFLLLALYFYPKEDKKLFYFFLGMSMSAKLYTLPAIPLFIIKYWREKRWGELKKMLLYTGIPIVLFLITPVFYLPNYLDLYVSWGIKGNPLTKIVPIYFKIIPFLVLFFIVAYKIKEADKMTISFISIVLTTSYLLWTRFYVRYFAPLLFYAHLFYYKSSQELQGEWEIRARDSHWKIFLVSLCLGIISLLISYWDLWFWSTV